MHAVRGGHAAVVAALAEGGAALNVADRKKTTALMVATMGQQHDCLKVTACPTHREAWVTRPVMLHSWSLAWCLRLFCCGGLLLPSVPAALPTSRSLLNTSSAGLQNVHCCLPIVIALLPMLVPCPTSHGDVCEQVSPILLHLLSSLTPAAGFVEGWCHDTPGQ